jgi:hypothetical protein
METVISSEIVGIARNSIIAREYVCLQLCNWRPAEMIFIIFGMKLVLLEVSQNSCF